MMISQLISRDILSINIISKTKSMEIEEALREEGFGVTRYDGNGKEGGQKVLHIICNKKNIIGLKSLVKRLDSGAFITSHTLEGLSGGYIYNIKNRI